MDRLDLRGAETAVNCSILEVVATVEPALNSSCVILDNESDGKFILSATTLLQNSSCQQRDCCNSRSCSLKVRCPSGGIEGADVSPACCESIFSLAVANPGTAPDANTDTNPTTDTDPQSCCGGAAQARADSS